MAAIRELSNRHTKQCRQLPRVSFSHLTETNRKIPKYERSEWFGGAAARRQTPNWQGYSFCLGQVGCGFSRVFSRHGYRCKLLLDGIALVCRLFQQFPGRWLV